MIELSEMLIQVLPASKAARMGVTRQSIIKVWLVERLNAEAANKPLNCDGAGGAH